MSAGSVVFLRHGRTAYNAGGRLQGQIDIPLDEVGLWQAENGARALAAAHGAARVITSDLIRARATAEHYASVRSQDLVVDPRARERSFGQWEGLTAHEIEQQWPAEHALWRSGGYPDGFGMETRDEVAARLVEAVDEHCADLGSDETLVVVSHGAAISIAITALLGLDPENWRGVSGLHNVHWSHLERLTSGRAPGWRLCAHNVGAGFPLDHWNFGPDWQSEPSSF